LADETFFAMRISSRIISGACVGATFDDYAAIMSARATLAIALALVVFAGAARAQVPVPPPPPPPLTTPSVPILPGAPSQLTSVPGVVATPLLTPAPIPTALPTPAPRLFNCSCFTTTSGTEWSGTVTASNYTAARSAATGACVSYVTSAPQSPFIPPGVSPGLQGANVGPTGSTNTTTSGTSSTTTSNAGLPTTNGTSNSPAQALKNSPSLTGQTFCNVCACN
jgi:hypothetical protein